MQLADLIFHLTQHAPAFARRLQTAGLHPEDLQTEAQLSNLPVMRKDQLIELQAAHPPFGGLLACDPIELKRIFQSPGPIYEPETRIPDYWRWQPALEAAHFIPGDRVLNCFGYHLTPAGAMFEEALLALGCTVIPGGIGNQEGQARLLHDLSITAYVGLPSYLKALIEKVEQLGLQHHLQKAFFTAEPLPPSLRAWLREHGVPILRQGYGTAECGNLGYECEAEDGWHVPEDVLIQVCDINTGHPLPAGETGEVVVTLFNPAYALIRFGTGDLSALNTTSCPCGRTSPRLMGWKGRVGDAVKVRGMFLHPRQLSDLLARFPEIERWQALITRHEHKDYLTLQVVPRFSLAPEWTEQLVQQARESIKFQIQVQILSQDLLPEGAPLIRDERSWD